MKKALILFSLTVLALFTACQDNVFDSLPDQLAKFVTRYYPDPSIGQYTDNGKEYVVYVRNGATFYFDRKYEWTTINGNSTPLPQILLYDQLPQALYNYIDEAGYLGRTYVITRTDKQYLVRTPGYDITYDIATGNITGTVTSTTH